MNNQIRFNQLSHIIVISCEEVTGSVTASSTSNTHTSTCCHESSIFRIRVSRYPCPMYEHMHALLFLFPFRSFLSCMLYEVHAPLYAKKKIFPPFLRIQRRSSMSLLAFGNAFLSFNFFYYFFGQRFETKNWSLFGESKTCCEGNIKGENRLLPSL